MGSFALAVAVGMQPDELLICGHDLFRHPSGANQGGTDHDTRPWQSQFVKEYLANSHRNHTLRGDVKYIRSALSEYNGDMTCVGSVLRDLYAAEFPGHTWMKG